MKAVNLMAAVASLVCLAFAAPVQAQGYPNRPIQLIVPFPPGGITDISARLVAERLGAALKYPVIVDNKSGAAGRIGAESVARAKPDGYTLLFGLSVTHGMLMASTIKPKYDPVGSFTPIAPLFWYSSVLICNPSVPAKKLAELIAYAKARPDGITYGSPGVGSGVHFMFEHFAAMAGIKAVHVPFRGGAASIQALVSGQIDCSFDGAAKAYIDAGSVRAFASSGLTRDVQYPEVPTLNETGLAGFDMVIWQALFGPAHLPLDVATSLRQAMGEVLGSPDFVERARTLGLNLLAADLTELIGSEVEKYRTLSRQLNISFE